MPSALLLLCGEVLSVAALNGNNEARTKICGWFVEIGFGRSSL
jgi:hypothetical protein